MKEAAEIAKNLLLDNINIDTITRAIGLTIEEVQKLQKEIAESDK
ncbi:MAG: hypothetical protein RCO49_08530 [Rickettsia endosymbiont of Argas persicus]